MATLLHAFALTGFLFFGAIARLGPGLFSRTRIGWRRFGL